MLIKKCIYCGTEFTKIDFPDQFDRMVTCGDPKCKGIRRRELFKKRNGG
ncbi:MAG: hypothetical protein KKC75_01130 [Nanoarchaeota archaeon]|nr:hypothetical protein [Nanoarchaeota archaeon]MBU1004443.1 hypothetical protein [Nanoarchaeota archaeon]MBU1946670.1 hypothetical protein [Nanoarchaeota archaeon]